MDWQNIDWNRALPYIVPVLVLAIFARRLIKNAPRRVNVGPKLFIFPLVAAIGTAVTVANSPMPALFWMVGYAVALALGAGVGFLTTHHQEFALDPQTGKITSKATPIGTIVILVFFGLRFGMRLIFPQAGGGYGPPSAHPSADALAWTDAGLFFATAMLTARAVTTWLHTHPLIAAHKSQSPPAGG